MIAFSAGGCQDKRVKQACSKPFFFTSTNCISDSNSPEHEARTYAYLRLDLMICLSAAESRHGSTSGGEAGASDVSGYQEIPKQGIFLVIQPNLLFALPYGSGSIQAPHRFQTKRQL
jgi:hypothetical protein